MRRARARVCDVSQLRRKYTYIYVARLDCECVDVSHFMCVCVPPNLDRVKEIIPGCVWIYVIRWKISHPSQRCAAPLIGSPRRSSSSLSSLSLLLSHYLRPLLRLCVIIPPHLANATPNNQKRTQRTKRNSVFNAATAFCVASSYHLSNSAPLMLRIFINK